ncbi:Transcription initiation factor TFIID subunit 7 [Operophtera brumata]|uniref:Transcription initiation factor TFIID subunit 7 n=1 Tax=Operophtera brumata TaxID=104452 RepID=A0A0L7KPL3_OPEBR|nr:Transcription initiation factor TFIID subunit 7 [Operophtera brumata]
MNNDRRELEYPAELESQFILRLPEEPAKELKQLLRNGDNMKNRLSIQMDQDMRKGEVKFDQKTMHGKIVDLPTIVDSLKTIDSKSFYKSADICQMMICKEEPEQPTEEELPAKNKKKDPYKVDKKFLFPHGITPPTKNVRKRRFRKTLKKKCAEAPEIEKEVKRLLRADNEAESITFEIINEDDVLILHPKLGCELEPSTSKTGYIKSEKKSKAPRGPKCEAGSTFKNTPISNVVDIFGGALSDSDLEDEHSIHPHNEDSQAGYAIRIPEAGPMLGARDNPRMEPLDLDPHIFELSHNLQSKMYTSERAYENPGTTEDKTYGLSFEDDGDQSQNSKDSMTVRIEQVRAELEELKERRKRTQHEIAGMENLTLRQRFQSTLHTLNQEVMFKEMEYQGLLTLQNSDDI